MAAMCMHPTPATTFEPIQTQTKSADEYRNDMIIQYAWNTYRFVITPREADEIIYEGIWEDVDDFVAYMRDANFGDAIPGTTNVKGPSTMRIYTSEELDAGLLADSDRVREQQTHTPFEASDGPNGDDGNDDSDGGDEEDGDGIRLDMSSSIIIVDSGVFEVFEEEELGWLPVYSSDRPPSYTSCTLSDPPQYTLTTAVGTVEAEEDEVAPIVENTRVMEPAPFDEMKEATSRKTKTSHASDENRTNVLKSIGDRIDRKFWKTKRKVSRVLGDVSWSIFRWC